MCDEWTEAENEAYLTRGRLSRRELSVGAGVTLASLLSGCPSPSATQDAQIRNSDPTPGSPPPGTADDSKTAVAPDDESHRTAPAQVRTKGSFVTIETPEGSAEAWFVAPEDGTHPGVLMWPDVAGLREAFQTMANRLAEAGYAVLCVNPYYRSSRLPVLDEFSEWQTDEGKAKIAPMRAALTAAAVETDASAFLAFLDQNSRVDKKRKLAAAGYCMSGSFAFRAAAVSKRVGAFASFHGGGLVTGDPDSPHLLLHKVHAAALLCIAQNDDARQPSAKTTLRETARAAHVEATIDVYQAQHGWCVLDSPVYDEAEAERAWASLLAMLESL